MDLTGIRHFRSVGDQRRVDRDFAVPDLLLTLFTLTHDDLGKFARLQLVEPLLNGLGDVVAQVRIHTAQRAQDARIQRHQHGTDADFAH